MSPLARMLADALAPGAIVIGAGLAVLPWLSTKDERARAILVAIVAALMWRYMLWRWISTLPPFGLSLDFVFGLIFVVIETFALVGSTIGLVFMTKVSNRAEEVERNIPWFRALPKAPLVDVFICSYDEEKAILERTIVGALALDHANKRVWVLDDGRRPWLQALSQGLGANYLARPDNANAKAGNINHAIVHVAGLDEPPDFISVLDADFVPLPNLLMRALPLFRDPDVGVVQTPQHFINPDPLQSNLAAARVWPDEQRYFFDIVMSSKDAWGAAFCCGTSSIIRFEPLWQVGGFPTSSVTEDYLLTLRLRAEGYRTVYLNERLSLGLAPEGLKEYITQRSRWALGFMQIWRGPLGPLRLGNGLPLVDRVSLIDAFLYWSASYAFRLLGILIPILYWLLDVRSVQADVATTLSYYLPYFASQVLVVGWMTRGRIVPLLSDAAQLLAASQILHAVAIGLLKPKGHKFQVTAKGGDRSRRFVQWPLLNVFLLYLALTIAGVFWAFFLEDGSRLRDSSALCLFWSWYNIFVLTIACVVCIEQPRLRSAERLLSSDQAEIHQGDVVYRFRVLDVSLTGVRLAGEAPAAPGSEVNVQIGAMTVAGRIARRHEGDFAVQFQSDEAVRSAMIRFIYSGRHSADIDRISVARVAGAILSRIAR